MIEKKSQIILTSDFESLKKELEESFSINDLRFFQRENFLIEDSKLVINEAMIAENRSKFIILMAQNYGIEAQNSLLRIVEEPPKNIYFIVVVPSKNRLLATIISRLPIILKKKKSSLTHLDVDFKKLSLEKIYSMLEQYQKEELERNFGREELKGFINALLQKCLLEGFCFNQKELLQISTIYKLAELNGKVSTLLTPIFLLIHNKVKKI
ncbi:DNA polymerase III subunit delta' [uncultured Campylobacter sp.]|uniref:DNA polymerase III subunit delta' n=1 Tax=uncultured Campylobacter sp. TaxID=218934 RepID=UPI00261CBEDD|nr:DNA polymerase III subunit delta' [uncultured Campylobacter sp.]